MDANILSEIASGLGMAGGLWALVRWTQEQRHNGHSTNGGSPSEPPEVQSQKMISQALYDLNLKQQQSVKELTESISDLVEKTAVREPQPNPEWVADLERRLLVSQGVERAKMDTLIDRVEALVQMGPPVVEVQSPGVPDLKPIEDLPAELEKRFDRLARQIGVLLRAPQANLPGPETRGPVTPAPGPITLQTFNTLFLVEDLIYELIVPEPDIYNVSIMNIGPGTLFMKDKSDLDFDDPLSTTIPPGTGDNDIHTPRTLFVLADTGGAKVSARLNHAM